MPDGKLKGLGVTWKNARANPSMTGQTMQDENRFYVSWRNHEKSRSKSKESLKRHSSNSNPLGFASYSALRYDDTRTLTSRITPGSPIR